jgi:hypothetical protein
VKKRKFLKRLREICIFYHGNGGCVLEVNGNLNKYNIKNTTKEQRKKFVKDAFAIGSLGSPPPPEDDLKFD